MDDVSGRVDDHGTEEQLVVDGPLGHLVAAVVEHRHVGQEQRGQPGVGFETTDSACPIKTSSMKKVVTLAGDDDYQTAAIYLGWVLANLVAGRVDDCLCVRANR